jgi:hypothetical protein
MVIIGERIGTFRGKSELRDGGEYAYRVSIELPAKTKIGSKNVQSYHASGLKRPNALIDPSILSKALVLSGRAEFLIERLKGSDHQSFMPLYHKVRSFIQRLAEPELKSSDLEGLQMDVAQLEEQVDAHWQRFSHSS